MSNSDYSGGFATSLTLLFIALKLCDVIDWSWWWVISPMALYGIFVFLVVVFSTIYYTRKR